MPKSWTSQVLRDEALRARWSLAIPHLVLGSRYLGLALIYDWIAKALSTEVERVRRFHPLVSVADVTGIQDAREARKWATTRSEGFLVLTGMEHVVAKTQDVLLKTLEETSLQVFLPVNLLGAGRLTQTVFSRCDAWYIPAVDDPVAILESQEPVAAEAVFLAYGDLDRAHRWLQDFDVIKLLSTWRNGPRAALLVLLDSERELSSSLVDVLHAILRRFLVLASNHQRTLPALRRWPGGCGSEVHRVWLKDQYLLITSGWYGEVTIKSL